MKAMVLTALAQLPQNRTPLTLWDLPRPEPGEREILLEVVTCGVCHTELDEIEGRTPPARFPMILGHQVVGRVVERGPGASRFGLGDRVGVGWIYRACGQCAFCRIGEENLCAAFQATGRDAPGGYAEYLVVPEDFAYPIPKAFTEAEAAPLLCAGAIPALRRRGTLPWNWARLGPETSRRLHQRSSTGPLTPPRCGGPSSRA